MTLQPRAKFVADCIYGQTKTGKTHQIAIAAQRMWDKYKLKTRYVSGDSGGFDTIGDLVDKGIVLPFILVTNPHPIEALAQICQGSWPGADGALKRDPQSGADVGLYALEGLTSFGDTMLEHLSSHKVRLSQDPAYTFVDGRTEFSGLNQSYFGEVQKQLYRRVVDSSVLPTVIPSVQRVIWTALEGRGEEEGTRQTTFGPSIAGKKAIGKAGQWFGNLLHLEMLVREEMDQTTKQINLIQKRVMYLQPHADPITKIPFPASTRAPWNRPPGTIVDKPYMDPPDVGKLYDVLEEMSKPKEAARAS